MLLFKKWKILGGHLFLTREWSQLYISELIQNHTTNKTPQLNMIPVGILCKWPAASQPEATKVAKIAYKIFENI